MVRLLRLRSAWGLAHLRSGDRRGLFAKLREDGWDGVEASLADIGATVADRSACCHAASAEGMALILSAYSSWPNYEGGFDAALTVRGHADAMRSELREIGELAAASPTPTILRVNAHSGSDAWSETEAVDYFEEVQGVLADLPVDVSHETHRGRYLCCPFATARLLQRLPTLRLTSDFSHWVVKCERLLDTAAEVELLHERIAPAVDHVHARIGTPQAPQVASPLQPTVRAAAERHYAWWEAVWSAREAASISSRDSTVSATIEYGPLERDEGGEYVGYTPATWDGTEAVAGVGLDATLLIARDALDERFAHWHGAGGSVRRYGW